jgi:hypothetical protein
MVTSDLKIPDKCIDIVRPFVDALYENRMEDRVQIFGGIGAAALTNADVQIITNEKTIIVPEDALDNLKRYRPEGTLRDLDCLVLSSDQDVINNVEAIARQYIPNDALELSFFGLQKMSRLIIQRAHPIESVKDIFLSDRHVGEENGKITEAVRALYPFKVNMPIDALGTWLLYVGRDTKPLPIPHPGAQVLNYLTRSISGLRPKDELKVDKLVRNIAVVEPEIIDWIVDGDGSSQLELGRIFRTLSQPRNELTTQVLGGRLEIKPYDFDYLIKHASFNDFVQSGRPGLLKMLLEAERIKSRTLHWAESQEQIVTYWQKHMEPLVQGLIKNTA